MLIFELDNLFIMLLNSVEKVAVFALLGNFAHSSPISTPLTVRQYSSSVSQTAQFALEKVLQDASPIFGGYETFSTSTSDWMKTYPDSTLLVHMNIPGTHDTQTWNYTQATQDSLRHITDLNNVSSSLLPPQAYQTQDLPMIAQLNDGIRVFDLRYAADTTNSSLIFYHSQGLLSETATIDDVLFGFYRWLDDHLSEVLFLSFQYEGSTKQFSADDAVVQTLLFNALTTDAARQYFLPKQNALGTLGDSRGKIILLRRFDLDQLPQSSTDALPGLHFSPNDWTDNSPDISLVYNRAQNLTAYIEDYYQPDVANGSTATELIQKKYNTVTANILNATSNSTQYRDSLFWTFASGGILAVDPPVTPRIAAVGNGSTITPSGGVNQQLVPFLKGLQGKRVGIVMFDFYEQPGDLISTLLGLSH